MYRNNVLFWLGEKAGSIGDRLCAGLGPPLFLWGDSEAAHFAIQVASLQTKQFSRARDVPRRFLKLSQYVLAFGRFFHLVQAAEAIPSPGWLAALRIAERQMPGVDAVLRMKDDDALHQITKFADIAGPRMSHQGF
jgi:hypothetical protein